MWQLLVFLLVLLAFHTSELLLAVIYMREELSFACKPIPDTHTHTHTHTHEHTLFCLPAALLLSKPYCLAMGAAVLEYWLEWQLLPGLKSLVRQPPSAWCHRDTNMMMLMLCPLSAHSAAWG